jgi:hypothetical protein
LKIGLSATFHFIPIPALCYVDPFEERFFMIRWKVYFFAFTFLSFTLGCEQSSDTVVAIPNVRVGCTVSDSSATTGADSCSSSNTHTMGVLVIMTRSGCGESARFDQVATGDTTLTCDASGCEATVTSWTDPNTNQPITEILSGRMDVCSELDISAPAGKSTNDLINESSVVISTPTTLTIDSWTLE